MGSNFLQIKNFDSELEKLQKKYGEPSICAINGGGCIDRPELLLLFMNPTARNIAAEPKWSGLRAPWLGTKNIWKMFYKLDFISKDQFNKTQKYTPKEWTVEFAEKLYQKLAKNKIYITNLAKCTQKDARPLKNKVFKEYLELTKKEILAINPKIIISFGLQVSTILSGKKINLQEENKERIIVKNKEFELYPTYYPVGQGMRNMGKAIERITSLRENKDIHDF